MRDATCSNEISEREPGLLQGAQSFQKTPGHDGGGKGRVLSWHRLGTWGLLRVQSIFPPSWACIPGPVFLFSLSLFSVSCYLLAFPRSSIAHRPVPSLALTWPATFVVHIGTLSPHPSCQNLGRLHSLSSHALAYKAPLLTIIVCYTQSLNGIIA